MSFTILKRSRHALSAAKPMMVLLLPRIGLGSTFPKMEGALGHLIVNTVSRISSQMTCRVASIRFHTPNLSSLLTTFMLFWPVPFELLTTQSSTLKVAVFPHGTSILAIALRVLGFPFESTCIWSTLSLFGFPDILES